MAVIEKCIGRALSLRHKLLPSQQQEEEGVLLSEQQDEGALLEVISELLVSTEVEVEGAAEGVAGRAIRRLFKRALQVGVFISYNTVIMIVLEN